MQLTPVQQHVAQFLAPTDPARNLKLFAEELIAVAGDDKVVDEMMQVAVRWVDVQRNLLRQNGDEVGDILMKDATLTLLGVWFMRYEKAASRDEFSTSDGLRNMRQEGVAGVHRFAATVEDDFLMELLRVTRLRAAEDADFSARLNIARDDARRLALDLARRPARNGLEPKASFTVDGKRQDQTMARASDDDYLGVILAAVVLFAGFVTGVGLGTKGR